MLFSIQFHFLKKRAGSLSLAPAILKEYVISQK
jgi:hypothetical protein